MAIMVLSRLKEDRYLRMMCKYCGICLEKCTNTPGYQKRMEGYWRMAIMVLSGLKEER